MGKKSSKNLRTNRAKISDKKGTQKLGKKSDKKSDKKLDKKIELKMFHEIRQKNRTRN